MRNETLQELSEAAAYFDALQKKYNVAVWWYGRATTLPQRRACWDEMDRLKGEMDRLNVIWGFE